MELNARRSGLVAKEVRQLLAYESWIWLYCNNLISFCIIIATDVNFKVVLWTLTGKDGSCYVNYRNKL